MFGDYNSIESLKDTTNKKRHIPDYDKKLYEVLSKTFNLIDICKSKYENPPYTHRYPSGASRIDKIFVNESIRMRINQIKQNSHNFTDHDSIEIKLHLNNKIRWGPGTWKLNISLLKDKVLVNKIKLAIYHAKKSERKI